MMMLRALLVCVLATMPFAAPRAADVTFAPGTQLKASDLNAAFTAIRSALEAIETAGYPPLSGTTAQRPTSPALGQPYFNTTTNLLEHWNGTAWIVDISNTPAPPTAIVAPTAPLNVTATAPDASLTGSFKVITVAYSASATGTTPKYEVEYATCGTTDYKIAATDTTPTREFLGTTLVPSGTCASVRVVAINDAGQAASPAINVTMPAEAPGVPLLSTGTVTDTSVALVWTVPSGAPAPTMTPEHFDTSTNAWVPDALPMSTTGKTVGSTMTFTITGLTAATTYRFRVVASNSGGTTFSPEVSTPTNAAATVAPGAPTALATSATTSSGGVATWSDPATGTAPFLYTVSYRLHGSTAAWTTAVTNTAATSYTFSGLAANAVYDVRVVAHNSLGDGTAATTTLATQPGAAPPPVYACTSTQTSAADPQLTAPVSCTINLGGSLAIPGVSIADDMTQCCGQLNITSTYGTATMSRNGATLTGAGTTSWNDPASLGQVNTDLGTLMFTAPATSGSSVDTLNLEFWTPDGHHNSANIQINFDTSGGSTPPATTTRAPWDQPFSANSVWNIGIGSGAQWGLNSDSDVTLLHSLSMVFNGESYSNPVYIGTSTDPLVTVKNTDDLYPEADQHLHIPASATPAPGDDKHMTFFDRTQPGKMWSYFGCNLDNGTDTTGGITCALGGVWDVTGNGVDQTIPDGSRYDFAVGLINKYDLDNGKIAHALRYAIGENDVHAPGANWQDNIIYPDWAIDFNVAQYTGGPNSIAASSTIGIPKSVDLSTLGLSQGGMMIAKALQDYGAIWRDTSADNQFTFYIEQSEAGNPLVQEMIADAPKIVPYVTILRNQSKDTINGGGTYSQPAPPPLYAPGLPTGGGSFPGAGGGGDPTGHQVMRAQDVWGGFGIDTHLDNCCSGNGGHSYADTQGVISAINYIGNVRLLRDYWEADSLNTLAAQVAQQTGAQWITTISEGAATTGFSNELARMRSFQASCHCVWAYDGANEWDSDYSATTAPGLTGTQRLQAAASDQASLYNAAKADGVKALQFTTGVIYPDASSGYRCCGVVNNADYANGHTYPESAPELFGEYNGALDWVDEEAHRLTPDKPVAHTEFGWIVGGTGFGLETLANQAIYTTEFIFDAARHGDIAEIYYGLYDDISGVWGLFDENNAPRPVAVALHNLSMILNDTASNARTFPTGLLDITFAGLPTGPTSLSGGQYLVMEKSDGVTFDVEVGNEQDLGRQGATITVAPVMKTVSLGFTATSVKVYDPINGGAAFPADKADWPVAKDTSGNDESWTNTNSFTMAVPSHPVIIEITHP